MRSRSFKKVLAAGLAAVIVGGAAIGVAAAQQAPTPSPTAQTGRAGARQAYISALANRLHISVDQLTQAMTGARQDAGLPAEPAGGFGGHGFGGGFGGRGFMGQGAATVASTLGITTDQLKQELPGHSLADVAKNHGKTAADLVTALTTAANKRIDDAVAATKLTADQAAQRKTRVDGMIPDFVNRQTPNSGTQPAHAEQMEILD